MVAEAFIPNFENKPDIDHVFNNKFDNFVENLRWVTKSENNHNAVESGAMKSGERTYLAKLTNEQALWCRSVYKPRDKEFGASALARKFGMNPRTMNDVVNGKTYKFHGASAKNSEAEVSAWAKKFI